VRLGRYEIQSELARGGQGCVYLALDPHTGDTVVIKLLESHDPRRRRRFVREARALADLDHPCVLRLRDLGEHERLPFLVLPYVEGQSLQDRIDRGGPLPVEEALRVAQQVGAGLQAVHASGLLHRDLKPANVLLSGEGGEVKLADFGIVKDLDRDQAQTQQLTGSGQFLGTPGYWPFEQVQGAAEVGPKADVYAFAATLYAALSGRPPRSAVTLVEAFAAFDRPVERLGGEVPPWLDDLLQRCLVKRAEERPPLDAVLQALASRQPLPAGEGRRLRGILLVGVVLAAAAGVTALLALRGSPAQQDSAPTAAQAHHARGLELSQAGKHEQSVVEYSAAIELDPAAARAYTDRGFAYYRLGKDDLALADFDRALALDPEDATAWSNRGAILHRRGELYDAVTAYTRAVEVDPRKASAWINRSAVYLDLDDLEAALADADHALELAPDVVPALYNRALVRERLGDREGALADFDRCLELSPRYVDALASRGQVRWNLGDTEGSFADFSRVLELKPRDEHALLQRARIHVKAEDYPQAEADFSLALEQRPSARGHTERGFVRYQLGDYAGALEDFDAALELDPRSFEALLNRGETYAALEDDARALADFEAAVRLDPQHPQAEVLRTRADECRARLERR